MGIKTRARRNRNFNQRAESFAADFQRGKNTSVADLDDRVLVVGTGKHRRLAVKNRHLDYTLRVQSAFESFLESNKIVPKKYALVHVEGTIVGKVQIQEFFHKPTLYILRNFLELQRNSKNMPEWERDGVEGTLARSESTKLCKQLLKQSKIGLESLYEARTELFTHMRDTKLRVQPQESNIIVLGTDAQGRIKFGIIDAP